MNPKIPSSCQVETAWQNIWVGLVVLNYHGQDWWVQQKLKVQIRTSKSIVWYNRKKQGAGHQEGTPVRNGIGSWICKGRAFQENVLESPKLSMAARESTDPSWVTEWPVAHQCICPIASWEHSGSDYSLADFKWAYCWCPHWVWCWQRHKWGLEEDQWAHVFCSPSVFGLPPVQNLRLGEPLPVEVCRWGLENEERIRVSILLAEGPGVGKPWFIFVQII